MPIMELSESSADEEQQQGSEIKEMFAEILTELRNLKTQSDEFRRETKQEIMSIKEDIKKTDEKWKEVNEAVESRITNIENTTEEKLNLISERIKTLETWEEQMAKRMRKNNIVIKGKEVTMENDNKREVDAKAKEILWKINANVEIENITYLGKDKNNRGIVRVTFKNFTDKLRIVRNKATLKGQEVYIDDDLTKNERAIQAALRSRAREERSKGNNNVKVGYQKILLNGQWTNWNDLNTKN